ncbi:zinc finger, CCHC-type containing protein [Tanacetum coccineum]
MNEPNESVAINCIIESKDDIFNENRFSYVPRRSQRSLVNGTEDFGGSMVPEKVTGELIEKTRDKGSDQHSYLFNVEDDPKTINDEMDSIMGNNTWVLADLPPGCKPLGCKWIFKRKLKVDGTIEKFKARLVIQGFKQKSGIDYFDTYALVARISIKRLYTSNRYSAIQKVLKYLKKTMDYGLMYTAILKIKGYTYQAGTNQLLKEIRLQVAGYSCLLATGKEVEWLKNLLLEIALWVKATTPISIHYDGAATLAKAYSEMDNGKSKHIGVRHSMIRELITNGVVSIEFVRSQQNLVDHLTKGLARDKVIKSVKGMGLKSN